MEDEVVVYNNKFQLRIDLKKLRFLSQRIKKTLDF